MNAKSKYNNLKFNRKLQEQFHGSISFLEIGKSKRLNLEKVSQKLESTERYSLMLGLFELGWASSLLHSKKLITSGKVSLNGFRVKDVQKVLQPLDIIELKKCVRFSSKQQRRNYHTLFVADHAILAAIYVGAC